MGAAIGFWVALTLAAPAAPQQRLATMRPINLNLVNVPPAAQPPPRPAFSNFQTPIPKPPAAPAWARALFGDPNKPPSGGSTRTSGGHGGGPGFGRGFGGGHRGGACHGGGHR